MNGAQALSSCQQVAKLFDCSLCQANLLQVQVQQEGIVLDKVLEIVHDKLIFLRQFIHLVIACPPGFSCQMQVLVLQELIEGQC